MGEERAYQGLGCTEACFLQSRPVTHQKSGSLEEMRMTYKWDGAFARTVSYGEEIQPSDGQVGAAHCECNGTQQLEQSKERERHKQQVPPAESVDREEGWDSEDEIDDANTHGPLSHMSEPVTSCSRSVEAGVMNNLQGVLRLRCSAQSAERN